MSKQAQAPSLTTEEINAAIGVVHNIVSTPLDNQMSTVPQVMVIYRNTKRAYGRAYLKSLGYSSALCILRQDFGLRDGNAASTWEKRALATFARTHGHNDRDAVILNDDSWDELIENVAKIELDPRVAFGVKNWMIYAATVVLFILVHMSWRAHPGRL